MVLELGRLTKSVCDVDFLEENDVCLDCTNYDINITNTNCIYNIN